MSENKMQPTDVDPREFVAGVEHPTRRHDAEELLELMTRLTGEQPMMWGPSIIGFGNYRYRYESGREGDAFLVGFAPQKARLSLYGLTDAPESAELLGRLGKHRTGVSCLYVNKLDDVDREVLAEMVAAGYRHGSTTDYVHRDD
ncbi:DUF1801 domain-containing protein [Georgenia sunbinii]|uniref:DUF1801 domain-containing protein n=1 Tax=Georgenia sunbinii TaxID=3117728 RepID=UPI002F26A099